MPFAASYVCALYINVCIEDMAEDCVYLCCRKYNEKFLANPRH